MLVEEERQTTRLARDRRGAFAPCAALPERRRRQLACLLVAESFDRDVGDLDRGAGGAQSRQQLAETIAAVGVLGAIGREEQQRGRVGWTQEVGEQRATVVVAPLEVVDADHERPPISDSRAQLTECRERTPPQLDLVGAHGAARSVVQPRHALQHREEARKRGEIARENRPEIGPREALEVARQLVDDAVEGLVGHRLLLEAAPGEEDGVGLPAPK